MKAHLSTMKSPQNGFSLVEIMVGMVIGLLGIIVIMQVYSVFEGQKRTTTGGDDAINGGSIALYALQNEISQAGYGLNSAKLKICPLVAPTVSLPTTQPVRINPTIGQNPAQPAGGGNALITATPNADANTDSLMIIYGSSNALSEGTLINGIDLANVQYGIEGGVAPNAASGVAGTGGKGLSVGDYVFADQGNGRDPTTVPPFCNPLYVTQIVNTGLGTAPVQSIPAGFVFDPIDAKKDYPTLYNLGPTPKIMTYAVIDGALQACDFMLANCAANAAAWTPIADGIVSMKASCVGRSGLSIALVARNGQPDPQITSAAPVWAQSATNPINLTGIKVAPGFTWKNYRYKVFETMIPIRNAVWSGGQGC